MQAVVLTAAESMYSHCFVLSESRRPLFALIRCKRTDVDAVSLGGQAAFTPHVLLPLKMYFVVQGSRLRPKS